MAFTMNTVTNIDTEDIKKYLFKIIMKSQWKEVVQIYTHEHQAHKTRITMRGDTSLHVAVSNGQEEHVEKLVKLITIEELQTRNERVNTPLHLAASMGNVRMSKCLSKIIHLWSVFITKIMRLLCSWLLSMVGKMSSYACTTSIRLPLMNLRNATRSVGGRMVRLSCIVQWMANTDC
ncbi:hypothetical protein D8674_022712 [Pyrus ussuriensis x Pyrus communis]|uniref:Uncharacterized protein n=1 Tax=Pyrus ussuriensis x Pyrus communis TaxID=2448454 RepID=A0A5N5GZD0_9ROSA|nr:hypothetical protein D8674_022712 [Pyrus ussuriensis x Pyrus communis]